MKTNFNKSEANFGCYKTEGNKQHNFLPNEEFTIEDVLDANVNLKDKAWFIRKNCQLTDTELREFTIGCALCVLPIYEEKYPENKAPREAIEAAQKYLKNEIGLEELREKRYAAADAADAADAASDAADAAYAAAYAYSASDAAYAAAYAADAAAYAADADADYKTRLLLFFKEFCKERVEDGTK